MAVPLPPNESERLTALRRYAILDTPPEEDFDRFTRLAMRLFNVPIALITLVDEERQWFKSCYGLDVRQTPRAVSMCAYTILSGEVMVVPDARQDPRFVANPQVVGPPNIRFYAGAPLTTPDGLNIGSVAIIDTVPRDFSDADVATLADLAALVVVEFDLRQAAVALRDENAARQAAEVAEAKRTRLAALHADVSVALAQGEDLRDILQPCAVALVRHLDAAFARIWTLDEAENMLLLQASAGMYTHLDGPHSRVPVGQFKIGLIAQTRQQHLTNAVVGDPWVGDQEWARREGMVAFAGYPLIVEDRLVGVMAIFARHPLADDVLQVMNLVANMIAVGIQRKQAEEALRQSEQRFRSLVQNSSDIITILEADGTIRYSSSCFERMLGYKPEDLIGKNVFAFVHPDDLPKVMKVFAEGIQTPGTIRSVEYRFRHQDGSWRILESTGSNLLDSPAVRGIVVNSRDITDRKQAEAALRESEEALRQAVDEAERASRAKSEFLSHMSHELRTPLNAILGFAQLLEMDRMKPAQQQESVAHILKAGHHLLDLINEVLDIARIETGRLDLAIEPVSVSAVLGEVLDLIRPLATETSIQLAANLPTEWAHYVLADHQRLKQVLLNLVSNAVKYNRAAGQVVLTWEKVHEDYLRIKVHDTGPGIPPEKLGRLFTPFERLDAGQSGIEGTGVGLALSRQLIEFMGGSIGVESTVGQGSTFWVELPLAQDASLQHDRIGPAASAGARAAADVFTVLYIEDNLSNLQLVERLLQERPGVKLLTAMQGSLGLDLAREHRPQLILLDLNLPDMAGFDVLRQLQDNPSTRAIPVVIISADATRHQIERLRAAGAHAYLTKPLVVPHFLQVVDEVREFYVT